MRNIAQYPITCDEVIDAADMALDHVAEKLNEHIGTTIPYSLQLLCEFIREQEPALAAFLDRKARDLQNG